MCQETPFILFYKSGQRSLEDIDRIHVEEGKIRLVDLRGQDTIIPGKVVLVDLIGRRVELA